MYFLKLDAIIYKVFTEFHILRQWVYEHGGKDLGEDTWIMSDGRVAWFIEEIDF